MERDVLKQEMPIEQVEILRSIHGAGGAELCFNYRFLERESSLHGLSRKELQQHVKELRKAGLLEYHRGLFDDEGQAAGSGFGIPYGREKDVIALLEQCENEDAKTHHLLLARQMGKVQFLKWLKQHDRGLVENIIDTIASEPLGYRSEREHELMETFVGGLLLNIRTKYLPKENES